MRRIGFLPGLLVAAILVLAACSGSKSSGDAEAHRVTVVALDSYKFEPDTIEVPRGNVTIVLDNRGSQQVHDLFIPALNIQILAAPGKTAEKTFAVKENVDFHCAQPGHEAGGMVGRLIVTD